MKEIKINGKNKKLRGTPTGIKKMLRGYNIEEMKDWDNAEVIDFYTRMCWEFLVFPKPFLTFNQFSNRVDIQDIRGAIPVLMNILYGIEEDGDGGNAQPSPK